MANRRRFTPHSRSQNERLIERLYTSSGKGMVTDTFRVPDGAFGELWNAKDHKTEVRGRRGSFLHTVAKVGVLPGEISGTLSDAFSAGALKGLVQGDKFQVYSRKDYSDSALYNAKKKVQSYNCPIVTPYDLFEVADSSTIVYLGNIAIPEKPNYYSTLDKKIKVSKTGKEITVLESSFTPDQCLIGTYFNFGYLENSDTNHLKRELIVDIDDGKLITNVDDGTSVTEYEDGYFQDIIYASYYHQEIEKVVVLVGDRLYESDAPLNGWREINGIFGSEYKSSTILDQDRPQATESLLHEVKGDLLLSNGRGHYRVVFGQGQTYYYKINNPKQEQSANISPTKVWGFKESDSDDSIEIVGFQGYNEYDSSTAPRGGGEYYINGVIL